MKRGFGIIIPLAAALAALLAVNVIGSLALRGAKADLTQGKLYTLSDGSKALLKKMDGNITAKLFYSRQAAAGITQINQYADRAIELLKQYETASGGKLTLEQLDPRPDTEDEEAALKYGLQPVSLFGKEAIFFGLVMVSELGKQKTIPFLSPEREGLLEYDITRQISDMSDSGRKTIGVLSTLDAMGGADDPMARFSGNPPAQPWVFFSELGQQYDLKKIETGAATIDEAIDLLLIVHPKMLSDATLYAIDQFVLRGGRAIVLADPLCLYEQMNDKNPDPNARYQQTFDSNMPKMFKAWGIEMEPGKVTADLDLATEVPMGNRIAKHPGLMSLGVEQGDQQDVVSANLEQLVFCMAGALKEAEGAKPEGRTFIPLLRTSARAGQLDAMMLKFGMDPERMRQELKIEDKPLTLAMKISGKFTTAFPDGKPAPAPDPENPEAQPQPADDRPALKESAKDTTVLVIADVDFLTDQFSVHKGRTPFGQTMAQLVNDNQNLANNAAENLLGAQELIALRTRGKTERPFTRVDEIEREADQKWKGAEKELLDKLQEAQQRVAELEQGKDESAKTVLSASQLAEIQKFRDEQAATKVKLREVRRNLRQDIESLGARIKFLNIALMPLLVLLAGFLPVLWRGYRMRTKS